MFSLKNAGVRPFLVAEAGWSDPEYLRKDCVSSPVPSGSQFCVEPQVFCGWKAELWTLWVNPFVNEKKGWFLLCSLFQKLWLGPCSHWLCLSLCRCNSPKRWGPNHYQSRSPERKWCQLKGKHDLKKKKALPDTSNLKFLCMMEIIHTS